MSRAVLHARRLATGDVTPETANQPGLYLHTSNRLELLARALASITRAPLASPFAAETIVVQSQGMARWLSLELARHHGICANCEFPFPKAFVARVLREALPGMAEESPFEPEVMTWKIIGVLPALLGKPGFEPVRHYLADHEDPRKLAQLAGRIAYLFDQYLIFRPNWIEEWSAGQGRHWQAQLWQAVAGSGALARPAALRRELESAFAGPGRCSANLPARLCIFGISALPPFYVELFATFARRVPVHLFLLQPSSEYWGEITSSREEERILRQTDTKVPAAFDLHLEPGNRLLASLGYLGRDFLKLLLGVGDWISSEEFFDPGEGSLLSCIQSDILLLRDRGRDESCPKRAVAAGDDSIQIHSCHSPLREMEVLQDHLLAWLESDPRLAPRDVVVMMPDIDTYAPLVQAVFGSPEDETKRIPFSLADRGARRESQIVEVFLHILSLPNSRFGAAIVFAPLECRAVRERFQILETDLEIIRGWIEQTNIRWGIDAEHRAHLKLPALSGNTWRDGLRRLLLGYAMAGREQMFNDVLPYDDIEGASADVLGHFVEYVECLFATVAALTPRHRLDEWAARLSRLLDEFFQTDDETEPELQSVRAALDELRQCQHLAGFDQPVELAVVLEQLTPKLEEKSLGSGFLTGGVTFCGLKPMRSIPFKMICLVGMNDSAFPRPRARLSFDLMAEKPLLGDRSSREDDRYLFLETILSARQRLYISYAGQSIRDNSEAPPSVLVSELMDYVTQGFTLERNLVTKHRLQAFSEAYFNGRDSRLFSYSAENCRASLSARQRRAPATSFVDRPLAAPESEFRALSLEDLAAFLRNPAKFFLNRRLSIFLRDDSTELDDREIFRLDALQNYKLKKRLLEGRLGASGADPEFTLFQAAGVLPLGRVGESDFHAARAEVDRFWRRLQRHEPAQPASPLEIDLVLGEFHFSGRVNAPTGSDLISFRCATIKPADLLEHWVRHLGVNAVRPGTASILVGEDREHCFSPCDDAKAELQKLLAIYWQGLAEPQKFFPKSSLRFAEATFKQHAERSNTQTPPLERARRVWHGNDRNFERAEREEPHFALCFRHGDPLDGAFARLAVEIFGPLLRHQRMA